VTVRQIRNLGDAPYAPLSVLRSQPSVELLVALGGVTTVYLVRTIEVENATRSEGALCATVPGESTGHLSGHDHAQRGPRKTANERNDERRRHFGRSLPQLPGDPGQSPGACAHWVLLRTTAWR